MELDKNKIKILIVDDDITFANYLYSQLDSEGYDVSVAFSAAEAKPLLFRVPFQIVFLDCLMPEMNGHTFAEEMSKVFGPSIQFILMSSVFKKHDVVYLDHENIIAMLEKPIEESFLKKELQQVVSKLTNPTPNNSLLNHLCDENFSEDSLVQKIEESNLIQEGDLLPLFFYLLRSKGYWSLKLSNDKEVTAQMVFKNGTIVHYRTNEVSHAKDFLKKQKLFDGKKDLDELISAHGDEVMTHLMDHGLISPHHYFKYRKESVVKIVEFFQKGGAQIFLEKQDESQVLPEHEDLEDISESYFIEKFTSLFQFRLNKNFLDRFFNLFKDYEIFVQDINKLDWMKKYISFLSIFNSESVEFNQMSIQYFCSSFPPNQKYQVYKSLFWLVSQGVLSFRKSPLIQLENLYIHRYNLLNKYFKSLNIQQLLTCFGCSDLSDKNSVKKMYHHYIKINHEDKFQHFSKKLSYVVGQFNKLVSNAYDTVMSEDKMNNYIQSSNSKEAEMIIEIEKIKENLIQDIKYNRYSKVKNLIQEIEQKLSHQTVDSQSSIQSDLVMWKMILEIEKGKYVVDEIRLAEMESSFKALNRFKVSSDVYFYLSCLFKVCAKQYGTALKLCDKSLTENEDFDLARLMKVRLNQWSKKGFGNWNSFTKKTS